mgnify:CR=1 FL=1
MLTDSVQTLKHAETPVQGLLEAIIYCNPTGNELQELIASDKRMEKLLIGRAEMERSSTIPELLKAYQIHFHDVDRNYIQWTCDPVLQGCRFLQSAIKVIGDRSLPCRFLIRNGNTESMEFFTKRGLTIDWNKVLVAAVDLNRADMVKLCWKRGARSSYSILRAFRKKSMNVFQLMLDDSNTDLMWVLEQATFKRDDELVRILLEKGVKVSNSLQRWIWLHSHHWYRFKVYELLRQYSPSSFFTYSW